MLKISPVEYLAYHFNRILDKESYIGHWEKWTSGIEFGFGFGASDGLFQKKPDDLTLAFNKNKIEINIYLPT